ncbi:MULTISPECIES: type 1 glutamine amidotransferase domain-containing protein [Halomonas]|uniref:type 1 glutamine amidotransferase domain-containing protein n=1 Tax=Halomonas TaxID=2745 RepID=UPI001A8C97EB|nr:MULTISPECIES: type 1 glutamine amidotransferase domain-containing protein [Halomonas]MED5294283.1 type 1 glutamine amidotransferase domain-containing protein [Pseudomonadota bacterium]MBN8413370.1 type 1 glutamine amidotransferase domain-containing protein [Halomonas litopenaei]MBY5924059.1 type 1 glutamine amidotransferase domain-containing protein [Halomonas sp. DP4Y7-2]MBY5928225.1 type 1 glutamine amidotransferase domain-containing protein [Halomonas sp. DP8Y7-3]MBY5967239.1 type 1 glut
MSKVLVVVTSHDTLGDTGKKTGFWLEELAAPYYVLKDAGVEVTLASPKGGQPPLDPASEGEDFQTDATRRFDQDAQAQRDLANTAVLSEMKVEDFDAIFYPGGHGPLWDLTNDADSIRLIEQFHAAGKPVSAVCHAPAVLLKAKKSDGTPFVDGVRVTGFTNGEEAAVGLTEIVPFLVEDSLQQQGGLYEKKADFTAFAIQDGLIITGQNPMSSEGVAELLLDSLKA